MRQFGNLNPQKKGFLFSVQRNIDSYNGNYEGHHFLTCNAVKFIGHLTTLAV